MIGRRSAIALVLLAGTWNQPAGGQEPFILDTLRVSVDSRLGAGVGAVQVLLDHELLGLVNSPGYPFTNPQLEEKDWSKSVEPFVVTAMISGLVYLFFSNQSSE